MINGTTKWSTKDHDPLEPAHCMAGVKSMEAVIKGDKRKCFRDVKCHTHFLLKFVGRTR